MIRPTIPIAALFAFLAAPAAAELPDSVRAMVEAAIETGDPAKVDTVADIAIATHPEGADEIKAMREEFRANQRALAAAEAERKREEIRTAGMFENWSGKGEIGAFRATGNSDNLGVTGGLQLQREGIDWTHKLRANGDYQRSNGRVTREKLFAAYEPRWEMKEDLFIYGLAQFDRDRFQGYDERYSVSGGLGYHVLEEDDLDLSVKLGPAFRHTNFVNAPSENRVAALVGLDFDWRITDRLTLTQDTNAVAEAGGQATAFIDGSGTTLNLVTGIDAKVSDRLTTRFAYTVDYDSDPAAGAVATDTLSRFTFVYGF